MINKTHNLQLIHSLKNLQNVLIQLNYYVLYSSWLITVLFVYKDLYSLYKM